MKHSTTKRILATIAFVTLLLSVNSINAQLNTPRGSQKATVKQTIGITNIAITYSRPSVKDREIWGKLVPYGMNNLGFGTAKESPWRVGANENTVIKFSNDVTVEGQPIKAGKYGLHMVVKEDGNADIIFSSNYSAWGSFFYNPDEDVLKVSVKTKEVPHKELLTFEFVDVQPTSTTAALIWEKKEIPFKIEAAVTDIVLADIRKKMQGQAGFNRANWEQAAGFASNNGGDLNEALQWIDAARNGQFFSKKTFANAQIKAGILNKLGKQDEGLKLMDESLADGTVLQVHGYGRQLITLGLKDKAMEVFKWNAAHHKNTWPVNYGLGRAYSAKGNYKAAIKYMNKAMALAPAQANKDRVQANIDKLKKGENIN
jgi:tetratricopeptide (TPR) repeat protein